MEVSFHQRQKKAQPISYEKKNSNFDRIYIYIYESINKNVQRFYKLKLILIFDTFQYI